MAAEKVSQAEDTFEIRHRLEVGGGCPDVQLTTPVIHKFRVQLLEASLLFVDAAGDESMVSIIFGPHCDGVFPHIICRGTLYLDLADPKVKLPVFMVPPQHRYHGIILKFDRTADVNAEVPILASRCQHSNSTNSESSPIQRVGTLLTKPGDCAGCNQQAPYGHHAHTYAVYDRPRVYPITASFPPEDAVIWLSHHPIVQLHKFQAPVSVGDGTDLAPLELDMVLNLAGSASATVMNALDAARARLSSWTGSALPAEWATVSGLYFDSPIEMAGEARLAKFSMPAMQVFAHADARKRLWFKQTLLSSIPYAVGNWARSSGAEVTNCLPGGNDGTCHPAGGASAQCSYQPHYLANGGHWFLQTDVYWALEFGQDFPAEDAPADVALVTRIGHSDLSYLDDGLAVSELGKDGPLIRFHRLSGDGREVVSQENDDMATTPLFMNLEGGGFQCPGFPARHFHQHRSSHIFEACLACLSGPDCANDGTPATKMTFRTAYCEGAGIVNRDAWAGN
eukprot:gnl/TRDRNA2_/TRDRNA2_165824_c1_seq1.p1 gnl/TRDRNA2_/TRDRNA2_165824_c1~~gnl/TRDRNA2_/TRDRNA2_165824_c1_seq1.p1  ORF type:complete len:530 (+),score=61.96 gnl/TRDRNA2_/TRDRNA2_165824_c1_seq1:65-1591(+)